MRARQSAIAKAFGTAADVMRSVLMQVLLIACQVSLTFRKKCAVRWLAGIKEFRQQNFLHRGLADGPGPVLRLLAGSGLPVLRWFQISLTFRVKIRRQMLGG